ncbi:MAG: YciI family protein [Rhodothermales bacterium]
MHYALICRDTPKALEKRLAARIEHLEKIHSMKGDGIIIDGGGILDDNGEMIGSVVLCDFPNRAALDDYLKNEIYVRNGVWQDIEILPFKRVNWSNT